MIIIDTVNPKTFSGDIFIFETSSSIYLTSPALVLNRITSYNVCYTKLLRESDSEKRAREAIQIALNSPLLCVDVDGATGALIHITGPEDMSLEEAKEIVSTVSDRLDDKATIIWGTTIDETLENSLRVLLIVTGTKSTGDYTIDVTKKRYLIDIPKI